MREFLLPTKRHLHLQKLGGLREIAVKTGTEMTISPESPDFVRVKIEGDGGSEWIAEQVLQAIAFGFESKRAFKLLGDDYFMEVIDLSQIFHSEKALERIKSRIIGTEGKARKTIEELSDAYVSVTGNSVAILGRFEELHAAKIAVEKLVEGSNHNTVYAILERQKRLREARAMGAKV